MRISPEQVCFYRGNIEDPSLERGAFSTERVVFGDGRDEGEKLTLPHAECRQEYPFSRPGALPEIIAWAAPPSIKGAPNPHTAGKPAVWASQPQPTPHVEENNIGSPEQNPDKNQVTSQQIPSDDGEVILPDGSQMALGAPDNPLEMQMPRSLDDIAEELASSLPNLLLPSHPLPEFSEAEPIDSFEWWRSQARTKVQKVWGGKDASWRSATKSWLSTNEQLWTTRTPPGGTQRTPPAKPHSRNWEPGRAFGFGPPIGGLRNTRGGGNEEDGGDGRDDGGGGRRDDGGGDQIPGDPGWTDLQLELHPEILGEEAQPFTKESCKGPFMEKVKELFKLITERPPDSGSRRRFEKFNWTNVEDPSSKENGTFLALIMCHIALNTGPISVEQNGLVDFFKYPPAPTPPLVPGVDQPVQLKDHLIQGTKLDFSAKNILTGVSQEDPRQFFFVNDEGDGSPPESPDEAFLRPALVLAFKMLQDLEFKKIKPTIISRFAAPHHFSIEGDIVMKKIIGMLEKVTQILHCVFEAQMAAENLADALEGISEENIDETEQEFEELVIGAHGVPGDELRSKVLKLSQGARTVNRVYNSYEMLARAIDSEGIKEEVAKKTFANPELLIKFLRNCNNTTCPWIKDSKKWSAVKPSLTSVSFSGEHTSTGERVRILQSPSRFLVERSLTHVEETLARIAELKAQVFTRIPPAPGAGGGIGGFQEGAGPIPFKERLKGPKEKSHQHDDTLEKGGEGSHPFGSAYPHNLLKAAADLSDLLLSDGPDAATPAHIISGHIDQLDQLIKEIQKAEWTDNVKLTPEHVTVRNQLKQIKTIFSGYQAENHKKTKEKEFQEREIAKSSSVAQGPVLAEDGANIDAYLEYHSVFNKASTPLARALRLKKDLPPRVFKRVESISDPNEIIQILTDLFCQPDVLIPQALKAVLDQKTNPRINTREEQATYTAVSNLVKRLEKQNLLARLDFTMINQCLARLSAQRVDQFELEWLKTKIANKGMTAVEEEEMKRTQFIAFVSLHEILLQKRTVQQSLSKKEEKEKKSEKMFHTRETKLDKKKKNREADRGGGGEKKKGGDSQYNCPLCDTPGGHPHPPGHAKAGKGYKSLARCEVLKTTPPNKRMDLVLKAKACTRCLGASHQVDSCRLDEKTPWLAHPACQKAHNPLICPLQKVERQNATKIDDPRYDPSSVVINLAEKAVLKDQSGRTHSVIAIHDSCSDSSWISSELAKSLPPNKKKRVNIPLQTIQGHNSFTTWEYNIQIQVDNAFKSMRVYESPSIGSVQYSAELQRFLQEKFPAIHLPQGDVSLLIGLRDHSLSPNSLPTNASPSPSDSPSQSPTNLPSPSPRLPDMKLYQSALLPSRQLACGTIPSAFIAGVSLSERSMFTQSELTKIITQEKGIDSVPQLCTKCHNKSMDCGDCKLLNRPTSLRELTENELIKRNLFFDKEKRQVCCKYVPTFSTWDQIFPPHLKNEGQARKVSEGLLKSLKKTNMLHQFQQVFDKFVQLGIFVELSKEEMERWEEEGKGVNYIHFHHVLKPQAQKEKQQLRIVTNSSASRRGIVDGKEVQCSLNSCLPQGSVSFNQLEEVAINWLCAPVSLLLDVKKAYGNIKACEGDDTNKHLRRMIWYKNLCPSEEPGGEHIDPSEVTYGISPCHYGDANASCLLANTMLRIAEEMPNTAPLFASNQFLKSNFVDDFITHCKDVKEAFELYETFQKHLGNYSMELHEAIVSSAEGRHMSPEGPAIKEPPEGEALSMKTMGFHFCPYSDSYRVPIQKRIKEPKKASKFKMKIGEDLTRESIMSMERLSLRQVASFHASIFDLCGHLAPLKIYGKRLLARIMEATPPISKAVWDQDLDPQLFEEAREYLLLMTSVTEPEFQRSAPSGELLDLACFHDGSSCAYGTGVWGIWTKSEPGRALRRKAKFLYAKARTARRTIPDQELSSMHQSVQISRVFQRIIPGLQRIHHFGDSEVSHKQICSTNCPKDTWTMNRVNSILNITKEMESNGIDVSFYHVKSEDNLADRISKPVEGAGNFVHSSHWKNGLKFLSRPMDQWPVDNRMKLRGDLICEIPPPKEIPPPREILPPSSPPTERAMITREEKSPLPPTKVGAEPMFSDLLLRVSRIRVATRAIARIMGLGQKGKLTDEDESAAWFLLLKDQQQEMEEKRIYDEKYMTFEEDGVVFSRQRWDIETHKDLFHVDKLPLVDIDSRLGELLLASAHRPPAGPCRTRSHTKYHLRSCRVAALLTGPLEKRLTSLMSSCVPCRKRKIGLKDGELTQYSPRMKSDRFKISHPLPFTKISCDTLGPIRVSLDTSGTGTRRVARYANHHILVIACIAGSGACRFIQIPSTDAGSFAMGLHRLVAYTGYPPSVIFTDFGSGLVSAGKKEGARAEAAEERGEKERGEFAEEIDTEITQRYPNIKFECAKSSEQVKNGKAESLCKAYKLYIKDVLYLKPNASLPEFTVLGLDLLCEEATKTLNQRPTAYLGEQDLVISPNTFLMAGFTDRVWGFEGELPTKYLQLQQYRERMYDVLHRMMVNADFTPSKWSKDERMPQVGDVCLLTRQKNKISRILEYAVITKVLEEGRTLEMRVCRQGTSNVKEVTASSRLAHLLFRPSVEDQ